MKPVVGVAQVLGMREKNYLNLIGVILGDSGGLYSFSIIQGLFFHHKTKENLGIYLKLIMNQ